MKILVINSGSSSIKFQLISIENEQILASGIVEQIGEELGQIKLQSSGNEAVKKSMIVVNHKQGMEIISSFLIESKIINSFNDLSGIGHRVVHGGYFKEPVLITNHTISEIENVSVLAPLHNPAHLAGIRACISEAPKVPQVAVFDTAYHQTLPKHAYMYAIPYDFYERLQVRKYGFHGTSHEYVAYEAAKYLGKPLNECNFITLHLGNGASVCAIKNGKSVDTSMGLTPLEGLIMGTRSGDIDPAVLFYISNQDDISIKGLDILLNKKSGLKGICGFNDMREVEDKANKGNEKSILALDMFCYRIKKYIGSYFAILGKIDALVFTGGIGENSSTVREKICTNFEALGLDIDKDTNSKRVDGVIELQTKDSKTKILKVPTNEELAIAKQTLKIIKK
ncbi:MAG: acetate/propionate family kinase [Campylobacteraceae bacterium]